MSQISWLIKPFYELDLQQLYRLLKLRQDVFVLEQQCFYADLDLQDDAAVHILGYAGEELVAYSRVLPPSERFGLPSIGRVIVQDAYRSAGLGSALMHESIEVCRAGYPGQDIAISAQSHLERFYRSLGFAVVSEPYDEDGIEHIRMRLS